MEELINKIESQGWKVSKCNYGDGDTGLELEQYSPAGEDFIFSIWCNDSVDKAIKEIEDYAYYFDEDEHVEMWVEAKYHGSGNRDAIPSIRELVYDAEAIHNMLRELAKFLINEYEIPLF